MGIDGFMMRFSLDVYGCYLRVIELVWMTMRIDNDSFTVACFIIIRLFNVYDDLHKMIHYSYFWMGNVFY